MKKQIISINKKAFTLFFASALLIGSTATSFAFPDPVASKQMEVSYKGVKDKMLVFSVDYKNVPAEAFQLVIRNDQNEILYFKKFDAKAYSFDILLAEVPEACKLTFSIKSDAKEMKESFEINNTTKLVQEYVVKGI